MVGVSTVTAWSSDPIYPSFDTFRENGPLTNSFSYIQGFKIPIILISNKIK